MYSKLPNYLTILRVLLVPILVVLLAYDDKIYRYVAGGIFIFASITDFIDGYLARKLKVESDFGKLMDPLADKLLVMSALVMLVDLKEPQTALPILPGWVVVLILVRESWITGLRGYAATLGRVVQASWSGKVKTVLQLTGITFLLFYDLSFRLGEVVITAQFIGYELLMISIFVSYYGATQYTNEVFSNIN